MTVKDQEGGLSRAFFLVFVLLTSAISYISIAQIGEQAGGLNFHVPVGGNQTVMWNIFNSGNTSIGYYTITPYFQSVKGEQTPSVVLVPSNGTLGPDSALVINVIVTMSQNNIPGDGVWQGLLQIREVSTVNASAQGGGVAVLQAGLGKVIFVNASPSTTSTSTTSVSTTTISHTVGGLGSSAPTLPISQSTELIIGAVVIVVIVVAGYAALRAKGKAKKRGGAARGRKRAAARRRASKKRASRTAKRRRRRR